MNVGTRNGGSRAQHLEAEIGRLGVAAPESPSSMPLRPEGNSTDANGSKLNAFFNQFARSSAAIMGSHWSFLASAAICILWAITGPFFDYSDTWQLVINTGTTVLTFLAVFLIQNTQNRDALAVQLKLDELLRALEPARTRLVNLENCSDEEIEDLRKEFEQVAQRAKKAR